MQITSTRKLHRAMSAVVEVLEDRRLLSSGPALTGSASVLVFNSAVPGTQNAGPSKADVLTLTDTGNAPLSLPAGGIRIVADPNASAAHATSAPAAFNVTNLASVPATLSPGQSVNLSVNYTASAAGIQAALLQIQSNDPTTAVLSVQLRGIGTQGQFGYNEPSLLQILTANNIPTNIGTSDFNNSQYPITPGPSSEVIMPRLARAGTGPVTFTPLASFDTSTQPAVRFGYYTPGDPTDRTELFTVNQSDAQAVNPTPQGATSFDPGGNTFGLYAVFPGISTSNGQPDIHYSEDSLNTLDAAHPRKFRFFPLENADGSVVANAYVVAAEDFNSTQFNSFTNLVGILRNVMPAMGATGAPVLGLENLTGAPSTTRMAFARIQNRNSTNPIVPSSFTDIVHDTNTLRIHNTGDQPLVISSLALSDPTNWQIVNPPAAGATVAANGGTLDITIKFIATSNPSHTDNQTNDTQTVNGIPLAAAGGVWNGTLTINSNDPVSPSRAVQLAGYWQDMSENENEPGLQTIVNRLFGYGTTIANSYQPNYANNGSAPVLYGEEVGSGLWNAADPSLPVSVLQLDAFHNQWSTFNGQPVEPAAMLGWYAQGSSGTTHTLFQNVPGESQSLFPYASNGPTNQPAQGSFSPGGTFGLNLDGELSQDSLNTTDINTFHRSGHSVRFWPARDGAGNLIPNAWLVGLDYQNSEFDNSDYQDTLYLVSNMRPAMQAPAPADVQAVANGSAVTLQWAPVSDGSLAGYNVYRASSASGPYTRLDTSPFSQTSFTDSNPGTGTVYYRVTAVDSGGESQATNASAQVTPATTTDTLTSQDINSTPAGSTAVVTAGRDYDVTAGGIDIGGSSADGFRYVYKQLTGNFDVSVQVSSLSQVLPNTSAGLMARASLDPGSQMVFAGASASDGYRFNYRTTVNTVGTFSKFGTLSYPNVWVRLVRQGGNFTGYYSTDGQNWTQMQSLTLSLPSTVYVGMAVSSKSTTQTTTAQLRSFTVNGNVGTTPTPLTPAEQVAADRVALKAAQTARARQLKAQQQLLQADSKAYAAALRALHKAQASARRTHSTVDPSLQAEANRLLAVVQADRATLATMRKTDFTGIAAARKTLASDLVILRKSRHHK